MICLPCRFAEEDRDEMTRPGIERVPVDAVPALGNDHAGTLRAYGVHDPSSCQDTAVPFLPIGHLSAPRACLKSLPLRHSAKPE